MYRVIESITIPRVATCWWTAKLVCGHEVKIADGAARQWGYGGGLPDLYCEKCASAEEK